MQPLDLQPLQVALLQTATHWHDAAANRAMFSEQLKNLQQGVQLAVLPEMFSTGFTMASTEVAETMQGPTVDWLRQQAAAHNMVLCGSVVIRAAEGYFNRFMAVYPNGELVHYDKRHLFRMAGEHEHYAAGVGRPTFEVGGWRILPLVCYDLRFPVWSRNRRDYDAIVTVANWPAARRMAWNRLLCARAIENQAYMVGVNIVGEDGNGVTYSGGSAVYAPDGETLVEVFDEARMVHVQLDGAQLNDYREAFPAWRDADEFELTK